MHLVLCFFIDIEDNIGEKGHVFVYTIVKEEQLADKDVKFST